jgi:hypothetical protein
MDITHFVLVAMNKSLERGGGYNNRACNNLKDCNRVSLFSISGSLFVYGLTKFIEYESQKQLLITFLVCLSRGVLCNVKVKVDPVRN